MARHHRSRKHPLFVLFIFTGLLEIVVFYFAVSRIAKEVAAGVKIHWIPYFTIGLAVVSCIYAALSIILFTSLPPRQIPCCSLIAVTTLFLGTAWSLSTVIQIFEVPNNRPSSSSTSTEPPMMKIRAILSGAVALSLFASILLSSFHAFNDEIPAEKDSPRLVRGSSIYSPTHTGSSVSQRCGDEARMPLSAFHPEQVSHSIPVELDSCPIEPYQIRRGRGPGETWALSSDYPRH